MTDTASVVWWHFSDIHWKAGPSEERGRYLDTLFDHLDRKAAEAHGLPDFVAVTGDVADSGKAAEYASFRTLFLDRLRNILGRRGAAPPFFFVPGNHDVDRDATRRINPEMVKGITAAAHIDELFQNEADLGTVLQPFQAFGDFQVAVVGTTLGLMPTLGWSKTIDVRGRQIHVVGANTAWACGYHRNDAGKVDDQRHLWLGLPQLKKVDKPATKPALSILLLHHPLSWLSSVSEAQCKNFIQAKFDVLLTGHVHTVDGLGEHITPSGKCLHLPAPVLHDRADTDTVKYARGYAVSVFDLETRTGATHYYKYSDVHGSKITNFLELYGDDRDHFPLDLRREAANTGSESGADLLPADPGLRRLEDLLASKAEPALLTDHTVAVFDTLIGELLRQVGVIERSTVAAAAEAVLVCRTTLAFQVQEAKRAGEKFQGHRVGAALRHFWEEAWRLQPPPIMQLPHDAYDKLVAWTLDAPQLRSADSKQLPDFYLRYYAFCWLVSQVCFYLDHPAAAAAAFAGDPRVKGIRPSSDATPDHNLLSCRFDPQSSQVVADLRVADRDGFLLMSTVRHFVDAFVRELADLWRRHHRVLPPLALTLNYPRWASPGIRGEYLSVEATPIIRLLMGKGLYGDTENVWFRELVQNALDANATRRGLSSEGGTKITIQLLNPSTCSIRDNGIGMSSQHITRYLTTLGRSIWASDELDEAKSGKPKVSQAIGQFGIGFASVFQHADRVFVYTRFFREIGEDGWQVDFTSVDKPFFVERFPCEIGTEVRVQLKRPLTSAQFSGLVQQFFIYAADTLELNPPVALPKTLDEVQLVRSFDVHLGDIKEVGSEHAIDLFRFRLRAAFRLPTHGDRKKESPPPSYLLVANSGVRVFEQLSEYLKPGKRYVVKEVEEPSGRTHYERVSNAIRHFYIIVDFEKGYSPILPSRNEIEITSDFSTGLRNAIHDAFATALRQAVTEICSSSGEEKIRRELVLACLTESNSAIPEPRAARRRWHSSPEHPALFAAIQELYRSHCPLHIQSDQGESRYATYEAVQASTTRVFALKQMTETSLFRVYFRAKKIQEWLVADSSVEFALLEYLFGSADWKGIREDRDIFVDRRELFTERADAPLAGFIRGDYAVIDNDIFSKAAFICLPANLPGSWNRGEAAADRRSGVVDHCPARVLLNARHPLIVALDKYVACAGSLTEDQLRIMRLTLDGLFDGVVEQERVGVARKRWDTLRAELSRLVGDPAIKGMAYDSLMG